MPHVPTNITQPFISHGLNIGLFARGADSAVAELTAAFSPVSSPCSLADLEITLSPHHVIGGSGSPVGFPNAPTPTSISTCPPVLHALGRGFGRVPGKSSDSSSNSVSGSSNHSAEHAPAHDGVLKASTGAAPTQPAQVQSQHPQQQQQPHPQSPPPSSRRDAHQSSCVGRGGGLAAAGDLAGTGGTPGAGGVGGGRRIRVSSKANGADSMMPHRVFPPQLTRRNSTSTIYLGPHDTLSDPDLDAAIRCVCAVFRAHMIEAVADSAASLHEDERRREESGGGGGEEANNGGGGGEHRQGESPGVESRGGRGGGRGVRARADPGGLFAETPGATVADEALRAVGLMEDSWQGNDVSVFDDPPPCKVGIWYR